MLTAMPTPRTLQHVLATAAETAPSQEMVARGFGLLLILLTAGVLLVMVCALLLVMRRNRHAQQRLDRRMNRPSSKASAWHAAGARAEPINPDPDLPSDDDLARGDPADGLGLDDEGIDPADPNDETGTGEPGPDRGPDDSGPWDLPDRSS